MNSLDYRPSLAYIEDMKHLLARALIALAVCAVVLIPGAGRTTPVRTDYVEAELLSAVDSAVPGAEVTIALRQTLKSGWHTYWRNPGDSGEATSLTWTLPEGFQMGPIQWPAPSRMPVGPLVNYGYSDSVLLPMTLRIPEDAAIGSTATLTATASWLVCKDICIPEDASLTLSLPITATPGGASSAARRIDAAIQSLPRPAGDIEARWTRMGDRLRLSLRWPEGATPPSPQQATFFPYDGAVIAHAAPQPVEAGARGLSIDLAPGFSSKNARFKDDIHGVVVIDTQPALEIVAARGAAWPDTSGQPIVAADTVPETHIGLWLALLLAFGGGVVLNVMPCVFPVLSLKAASMARHSDQPAALRLQGLAFLAGVQVTFLSIAGLMLSLRAAGQDIGWGFQLQSPWVVSGLMLVMLAVGLHLSGVFTLGGQVQNIGQNLTRGDGPIPAFFTGVLAVAVAAPCTAPFMATALGYAIVQPAGVALAVFAALGLGMAAPLLLFSFSPWLARHLPRPGAWMERFKQVLAWPMYAAAAWLVWVIFQQLGPTAAAAALTSALLLALACWTYGVGQTDGGRGWRWAAAVALVLCALTTASVARGGDVGRQMIEEPFSPERLSALRADNKPVFVYFTAAWCVTCLVNERTALATPEVISALQDGGYTVLKGDWTNRDPAITQALAQHKRAGVPLYLVYPADRQRPPEVLPQLLTPGLVRDALKRGEK